MTELKEIKTYYKAGQLTLKDIEKVFEVVKSEKCIVNLKWWVSFDGIHEDMIDEGIVERYTPEDYYDMYRIKEKNND